MISSSGEPRVLLLSGNPGSWHAKDRLHEAATMNSTEAWVFAFGGSYMNIEEATPRDVAAFDIIIGNTDKPHNKLLRLAESRPVSTKWVTLLEGSATDYLRPLPHIQRILDASNLVNVINKHSTGLFRMMTKTRVEYIGIPYPAAEIRKLATPIADRSKGVYLCPLLTLRWSEVFVARKLGLPYYGYEHRLSRRLKTIGKHLRKHGSLDPQHLIDKAKELYSEPTLDVSRERTLPDHMHTNGQALLWLNFDPRYTWGRNVLDAAALGVPVIATRSTGHAEDFFPQILLETPFELEKAYGYAKRLIEDKEYYKEVATIPIERFEHLRPEAMKEKLLRSLA
jgi:hypothetical protein